MLKGDILITSNVKDVMELAPTHLVICVSGETHNYRQMIDATGATEASILLPPYEASAAELDGDMVTFENTYFAHLTTKIPSQFIALIVRALVDGRNVLIYLTPEESKMAYIKYFFEYFRRYLGISIGSVGGNPCAYDINYDPVILNIMFMNDVYDSYSYLKDYPMDKPLPIEIVNKLATVLDPVLSQGNYERYVKLFDEKRRLIKSSGQVLQSPFTKG